MFNLIDIAARTGQPPVRALLSRAIGTNNADTVLTQEIRYRNDQYRVIYGLYEDDDILGIVGLARDPGQDLVEIVHLAVAGPPFRRAVTRTLIESALGVQRQHQVRWSVPEEHESIARELRFRQYAGEIWKLDRRGE